MGDAGIKLLFLVTEDWYFCSHRLDLARAAIEEGYEVLVVTHINKHKDLIREAGIKGISINFHRSLRNPWQDLKTLYSINKIYRAEKPDIVHHVALKPVVFGSFINMFLPGISSPVIINALTGMGYLFTSCELKAKITRFFVEKFLRVIFRGKKTFLILQNSDDMNLLEERKIVKKDHVSLIRGSGVNINLFRPSEKSGDKPVVMLVARMLRDKGVEEFVLSAQQLKKQGLPARFVLVGDIDNANPSALSKDTLTQWQEERNVEWWGRHDDMVDVYKQADVIVLPSYREGLPKVLLEAAACGLPIVASDVPGCREIVIDGENGLLVPARNADKLSEAIRKMLESPELRQQMGRKGRALVEKEFSLDKIIRQTLDLYHYTLSH